MAARFTPRPARDRITVKITAGSCREASNTLVNAGLLIGRERMRMADGPERQGLDRVQRRLWQLAHWFGRLLEEEE